MINFLFFICHLVALIYASLLLLITIPIHILYASSKNNREKLEQTMRELSENQVKIAQGMTSEEIEQERKDKLYRAKARRRRDNRNALIAIIAFIAFASIGTYIEQIYF